MALAVVPVTPDRWPTLLRLFGPRGACAGCWCMWWRRPAAEFRAGRGEGNRAALAALVEGGDVPGLLALEGGEPVGWIALAPREAYPRLARSRNLRPVDDRPVWSVTCFFIARGHRRRGVARTLLAAAVEHARARGATLLEGYPVEARSGSMPDAFAWTGLLPIFTACGFVEVARRGARPILRRALRPEPDSGRGRRGGRSPGGRAAAPRAPGRRPSR